MERITVGWVCVNAAGKLLAGTPPAQVLAFIVRWEPRIEGPVNF